MPDKVVKNKAATPEAATDAKIKILKTEEVSRRLRLPLSTVYYLAKTGALPGFQLGRSWRFYSDDLDRLACSRPPMTSRILVVDNDTVTREFVKGLLASRNCTVAEAGNVDEALTVVQQQRFNLFLVDFKLPGKDGMEFIRQIANDYSLMQVVVITAFADLAQADKLFGLGAMTLLRKPLDADQLIECVDRILGTTPSEKNFSVAPKVARRGQWRATTSARLKQSIQSLEPIADVDR